MASTAVPSETSAVAGTPSPVVLAGRSVIATSVARQACDHLTRRQALQGFGALLAGAALGAVSGCGSEHSSRSVSNIPPPDIGKDATPLLDARGWDGLMADWSRLALGTALSHALEFGLVPVESRQIYLQAAAVRGLSLPPHPFSLILSNGGQGSGGDPQAELLADARVKARLILQLMAQGSPGAEDFYLELLAGQGLGFQPAGKAAIAAAEDRLKQALPPSYKQFLAHSDGWLAEAFRLAAVEELKPFELAAPDLADTWPEDPPGGIPDADYFVYGPAQRKGQLRHAYVLDAQAISVPIGSRNEWCLLNPHIVFADGEWETWLYSRAIPGALRFRSFAGLFEFLYKRETQALAR